MLSRTFGYAVFGLANVIGFSFITEGGSLNSLIGIFMFVGTIVANVIAFHAVTKEKFKNLDEWKQQLSREWAELQAKANKVDEQERRIGELEEFRKDYWQQRAGNVIPRLKHRES